MRIVRCCPNDFPYDYRSWWGLVRAETNGLQKRSFSRQEYERITKYYQNALAVCKEPSEISCLFTSFDQKIKKENALERQRIQRLINEEEKNKQDAQQQFNEQNELLNRQLFIIEREIGSREKRLETRWKFKMRNIFSAIGFVIGICIAMVYHNGFNEFGDSLFTGILFTTVSFVIGWFVDTIRTGKGKREVRETVRIITQKDAKSAELYKKRKIIWERQNRLKVALSESEIKIASLKAELPEAIDNC